MTCHNPNPRGTVLWTLALVLGAMSGAAWADWHAPHNPSPTGRTAPSTIAPISATGAVGAPSTGVPA